MEVAGLNGLISLRNATLIFAPQYQSKETRVTLPLLTERGDNLQGDS